MANQLVIDWMRPIIRVSKAIADRDIIPMIDYAPRRASASGVPKKETGPGGMATNESIARRHARIPEALTATFTVAPPEHASQRNTEAHGQVHGPTGVTSKMKEYKKKLVAGKSRFPSHPLSRFHACRIPAHMDTHFHRPASFEASLSQGEGRVGFVLWEVLHSITFLLH